MSLDLREQRVLVLGLGRTGQSAAAFCAERGARVLVADERSPDALGELPELPPDVRCVLGAPFPDPSDFDLVVPSPGVPPARYAEGASRVWGDIELYERASVGVPLVAITGTNGKSTTTCLVEACLRSAGLRAQAAGNLGRPALELLGEALDVAVLEVSSFQLEATESFRPAVATVLNLSPDHLDRHGSFEAYVAAKARILANQGPDDVAVLSFDDPGVRALAERTRARVIPFRTRGPLDHGAWFDSGALAWREPGGSLQRLPLDAPGLPGAHNRENLVAAVATAIAAGADPERAVAALPSFRGLPHRCEPAGEIRGVTYVDDSKATNPGAALRALEGFPAPLVWIAGGRGKGLDFTDLAKRASERVRVALLIGEAAEPLERALAGRVEVVRCESLPLAVGQAAERAREGETVLLAPACASQDQFVDYTERGRCFQDAVAELADPAQEEAR